MNKNNLIVYGLIVLLIVSIVTIADLNKKVNNADDLADNLIVDRDNYELALSSEMLRELNQRQEILIYIMDDMFNEDNSYQTVYPLRTHLRQFEETTILPEEVDRFYNDVILVALDGYANGFDDEIRQGHIAVFTMAVIEISAFDTWIDAYLLDEEERKVDSMSLDFKLDYSHYTDIVRSDSDLYEAVNEYFKNLNDKYLEMLNDLNAKGK